MKGLRFLLARLKAIACALAGAGTGLAILYSADTRYVWAMVVVTTIATYATPNVVLAPEQPAALTRDEVLDLVRQELASTPAPTVEVPVPVVVPDPPASVTGHLSLDDLEQAEASLAEPVRPASRFDEEVPSAQS